MYTCVDRFDINGGTILARNCYILSNHLEGEGPFYLDERDNEGDLR